MRAEREPTAGELEGPARLDLEGEPERLVDRSHAELWQEPLGFERPEEILVRLEARVGPALDPAPRVALARAFEHLHERGDAPEREAPVADDGLRHERHRFRWEPGRADVIEAARAPALELVAEDERVQLVHEHVVIVGERLVEAPGEEQARVRDRVPEVAPREALALEARQRMAGRVAVVPGEKAPEMAQRDQLVLAERGAPVRDGDGDAHHAR